MLRKFAAVLMISAFTHVSAMQPIARTELLGKTFDELNYSLNVEWDQRDQGFFNASVDEFEKHIASLQKEGLSNKELVEYTMNKIKDEKTKKEVEAIVNVVNESNMSQEEARAFIMSKLSKTYANGASWSGGRVGVKLALLLAVILIIVICHDNDEETRDVPPQEEPCDNNGGYHGGYDSFTSPGFSAYGGTWDGHGDWDNCHEYPTYQTPV
jgi:hypothetical protein